MIGADPRQASDAKAKNSSEKHFERVNELGKTLTDEQRTLRTKTDMDMRDKKGPRRARKQRMLTAAD
jgi:hypothetical protein